MVDGAISVIVPTLNAGRQIDTLLTRLEQQTRKPDEIIVVDSSSEDITQEMIKRHPAMLRESTGDFVLFLTQDAMPSGNDYIAKIVAPFADDEVALVYGRQLPRKDARPAEALVRKYSYGDESMVITELGHQGLPLYRCVCSLSSYGISGSRWFRNRCADQRRYVHCRTLSTCRVEDRV